MDALATTIRAENMTLTQQNLNLRQQIASLRNDRLELQYKLVEAIEAKESFKIEVIKLITQTQNTFERLKTFIEHTTSTPPPPTMLSGTEKLLRRQIVGGSNSNANQHQLQQQQQQQHHHHHQQRPHGILRQIPIHKDTKQIPMAQGLASPPLPLPQPQPQPPSQTLAQLASPSPATSASGAEKENDNMHFIDEKIRKLNTILKKYKSDVEKDIKKEEDVEVHPPTVPAKRPVVVCESRRFSKRLQSIAGPPSGNVETPPEKEASIQIMCALRNIGNEPAMRGQNASGGCDGEDPVTATPRMRSRKRKILV